MIRRALPRCHRGITDTTHDKPSTKRASLLIGGSVLFARW
jgi:hypothetical protein